MLLLDGKPVESQRSSMTPEPSSVQLPDGHPRLAYVFAFPCPAPGKHILQARYKANGVWSRISNPLHFDVRLPEPPRIVAVSDDRGVPIPIGRSGPISITTSKMTVHLANLSRGAQIAAYLNSKPVSLSIPRECFCSSLLRSLVGKEDPDTSCCRTIELRGQIIPGIHSLRIRSIASSDWCRVTSEPSEEVVFHYSNESDYLLPPGSKWSNRTPERIERAQTVHGPASPFFFASAAHFPMPGYGLRGDRLDQKGLVIYEDMEFRFNRNGDYEVHFRTAPPAVPTVVELQFHIQSRPGAAWYTVTLAPLELRPSNSGSGEQTCQSSGNCTDARDRECCDEVGKRVCRGHSEILRRYYAEMGPHTVIRRTGTARFGYGLDILRQAASF